MVKSLSIRSFSAVISNLGTLISKKELVKPLNQLIQWVSDFIKSTFHSKTVIPSFSTSLTLGGILTLAEVTFLKVPDLILHYTKAS
mmetsp:Transcript_5762/g.818  ORF Transcript_5762/g.818 Transcript_5762/m.818 type:complete len:86 (-) Transcript_5762:31-288(-)